MYLQCCSPPWGSFSRSWLVKSLASEMTPCARDYPCTIYTTQDGILPGQWASQSQIAILLPFSWITPGSTCVSSVLVRSRCQDEIWLSEGDVNEELRAQHQRRQGEPLGHGTSLKPVKTRRSWESERNWVVRVSDHSPVLWKFQPVGSSQAKPPAKRVCVLQE